MSFDELEELMSEPPGGGELHGRKRVAGSGWWDLDPAYADARDAGFEYIVNVPIHGLRSTYNDGCRCPSCKRAEREYRKQLRRSAS